MRFSICCLQLLDFVGCRFGSGYTLDLQFILLVLVTFTLVALRSSVPVLFVDSVVVTFHVHLLVTLRCCVRLHLLLLFLFTFLLVV